MAKCEICGKGVTFGIKVSHKETPDSYITYKKDLNTKLLLKP